MDFHFPFSLNVAKKKKKKKSIPTVAVILSLIFMKINKAACKVKRLHSLVSMSGSSVGKAKMLT